MSINKTQFAQEKQQRDPWDVLAALIDASIESLNDGDNSQEQQQQSIAGDADAEATQVDRQETPSIGAEKVSGRVIEENGGLSTIKCMYCGLSDYQIRSGDGSEARLVQHRENACSHLLSVCDRCVRKCTGKRRLQCIGCGNKVKSVAVIGHRNASAVGPIHASDGDESEDNDQTVTCDDLLPIECMHCGVKESETRTDDGSKARLVQHNDKACGCLLAVCDRCVRQCKGSRRLQCMCCGEKVKTVVAIEPGEASSVVRQFVEQSTIVGVSDKTCGQCRRQVPLLMLHARYGCGALLDACFDCAADVNVSIMCSGCAHKVCGQVVPVGSADVARKAMGTRKRKQPQRFGDYTLEKHLSQQGKKNGIDAMQHQRAALEIGSKQRHKKRRLTSAQVAMQVLSSVETTARNVQAHDDDDDDYEYEFLDEEAERIHLEQERRRRARQSKENVAEVDNRDSVGSVGIE